MAPFIDNSYFFCRYIIQVTFLTNSLQLLQVPTIFVRWFKMLISRSDYEKVYAFLIKKHFDFGFHYSFTLIVFLLSLIFSTTIPLIVPFGSLFFYLKYMFDKYNLLFFYPIEFDGNRTLGDIVIKFLLFSIFFFQLLVSGLFYVLSNGSNEDETNNISLLYLLISIIMYFISQRIFSYDNRKTSSKLFDLMIEKQKKNNDSNSNLSTGYHSSYSILEFKKSPSISNMKNSTFESKHTTNQVKIVKNTDICLDNQTHLRESFINNIIEEEAKEIKNPTDYSFKYHESIQSKNIHVLKKDIDETIKLFEDAYMHPTQKQLKEIKFIEGEKLINSLNRSFATEESFYIHRIKKNKSYNIISEDEDNILDEIFNIN